MRSMSFTPKDLYDPLFFIVFGETTKFWFKSVVMEKFKQYLLWLSLNDNIL